MVMAKKLVSMKFEPAVLARVDAKARAQGIDRTSYVMRLIDDDLDTAPKPKRTKAHVAVTNPASTAPKPKRMPATPKTDGGKALLVATIGATRKRKPRQPGEVRVSDAPIATWGENRPAPGAMLKQPKKAK